MRGRLLVFFCAPLNELPCLPDYIALVALLAFLCKQDLVLDSPVHGHLASEPFDEFSLGRFFSPFLGDLDSLVIAQHRADRRRADNEDTTNLSVLRILLIVKEDASFTVFQIA